MSGQTLIGERIVLEGDLGGTDEVIVRGVVKGRIEAAAVRVEGEVEGDITAGGRVELCPDAKMTGDIRAGRILIADGARFSGSVDMNG